LPEIPSEYLIFLWRRKFKVSYLEAMLTPLQAMQNDFAMLSIENEIHNMREAQRGQKDNRRPV